MKIRLLTFNLFLFVKPPFSYYKKENKLTNIQWQNKLAWIKKQITETNADVIGFQEVFSINELKLVLEELGFNYFKTIETPRVNKDDTQIYTSSVLAIASKYEINSIQKVKPYIPTIKKHQFETYFKFARLPIKATIQIDTNIEIIVYVSHFSANKQNEFEYTFNKTHNLTQKKEQSKVALEKNYSGSLKKRLCEASSLFYDISKTKDKPCVLLCDLNDKEYSLTLEALSNYSYHNNMKKNNYILFDTSNLYTKPNYNPHPEQKEIKKTPTIYFEGKGNVLDYIFVNKLLNQNKQNSLAKVSLYEVFDKHLIEKKNNFLDKSDHALVLCELDF